MTSAPRLLNARQRAPADLIGASIALGVLDGVHRGHQAVFAEAAANARQRNAPLAAAVFEPHPRHFFSPDAAPFRLQNAAQRARALTALGAQAVFQIPFDAEMAALSAEQFEQTIIVDAIGAGHVSVGEDFRFARHRSGDVDTLRRSGERLGYTVSAAHVVTDNGERISSTRIRGLIAEGKVKDAAELLSRPFAIEGEVIQGFQRGRTINFPTANLGLGAYQRPLFGVYAVRARVDGGASIGGVANCGVKPTVSGDPTPLLETHLFDFSGDLYGKMLEVELIAFIRAERKFENFDALRAQIEHDAQTARGMLG